MWHEVFKNIQKRNLPTSKPTFLSLWNWISSSSLSNLIVIFSSLSLSLTASYIILFFLSLNIILYTQQFEDKESTSNLINSRLAFVEEKTERIITKIFGERSMEAQVQHFGHHTCVGHVGTWRAAWSPGRSVCPRHGYMHILNKLFGCIESKSENKLMNFLMVRITRIMVILLIFPKKLLYLYVL